MYLCVEEDVIKEDLDLSDLYETILGNPSSSCLNIIEDKYIKKRLISKKIFTMFVMLLYTELMFDT